MAHPDRALHRRCGPSTRPSGPALPLPLRLHCLVPRQPATGPQIRASPRPYALRRRAGLQSARMAARMGFPAWYICWQGQRYQRLVERYGLQRSNYFEMSFFQRGLSRAARPSGETAHRGTGDRTDGLPRTQGDKSKRSSLLTHVWIVVKCSRPTTKPIEPGEERTHG